MDTRKDLDPPVYFCRRCYMEWCVWQDESMPLDLSILNEAGEVELKTKEAKAWYRMRLVYFTCTEPGSVK